jgi:DNA-directed RNA polymerase subunit RPC12/RpoP
MIEFDVDMGYLLECDELDKVVLNDESGEHEPMEFVPKDTATVGVGTCKLVDNDSGPDMHCTACGGGVDDEYRYFMDSWGYSRCPHCGARIIEEETE